MKVLDGEGERGMQLTSGDSEFGGSTHDSDRMVGSKSVCHRL